MIMRWTSDVPSPISRILASRQNRATGVSFMKPYPPWIWVASRALATAISLACSLAIAACRLKSSPAHQPVGGVVPGQPRGVGPRLHVGDLELDRLERTDRLAERLPLPGVAQRLVDAALGQPGGQRGDRDPALVEGLQELGEAAAPLAEQVGRRHPDVVEGQLVGVRGAPADLGVAGLDGEARRARTAPGSSRSPCGRRSRRSPRRPRRRAVMSVPELVMNALLPLMTHSSVPRRARPGSARRRRRSRTRARSARTRPAPRR